MVLDESVVEALSLPDKRIETWGPEDIKQQVLHLGFVIPSETDVEDTPNAEHVYDDELRNMEKIVRYFMRSTHISESVILIKLGLSGKAFIANELPRLLKQGIMDEIENRGGSSQRRFKLKLSLHDINEAIVCAKGSFDGFLACCEKI